MDLKSARFSSATYRRKHFAEPGAGPVMVTLVPPVRLERGVKKGKYLLYHH